jgi:hypothetical protein
MSRRTCRHCGGSLEGLRSDARCCSVRCRQAWARFQRKIKARARAARPLRLAYADPPYPGKSYLYRGHPDYAGEVDHRALLDRLVRFDGWALSTSAAALPLVVRELAELGVPDALEDPERGFAIASWGRGGRPGRARRPRSAWEPVVYRPARFVVEEGRVEDLLVVAARRRSTDPGALVGMKPAAFLGWLFELLAARPGDALEDFFPGSGGVGRAWRDFTSKALDAPEAP